jgi:hypothetical protein
MKNVRLVAEEEKRNVTSKVNLAEKLRYRIKIDGSLWLLPHDVNRFLNVILKCLTLRCSAGFVSTSSAAACCTALLFQKRKTMPELRRRLFWRLFTPLLKSVR